MTGTATTMGTTEMNSSGSTDTLIAEYRDRLRRATADLPPGRRAELLDDIDAHLTDVTADAPDRAKVLQALDELGTPEAIAEAARADAGVRPARGVSGDLAYDVATVLVLMLGGFVVPLVGWIAGVVMLWNGPRWTPADRWIGTLAWPAAIAPVAGLFVVAAVVSGGAAGAYAVVGTLVLVGVLSTALLVWPMVHLLRASARRRA